MKAFFKKLFIILLIIFIVIQFFRPSKNITTQASVNDITTKYIVPTDVQDILKTSCYDCHSNNTAYPWYNNIQPIAWWLNNHIKDGKRSLNFNEFAAYKINRQYKKLDDIMEEVNSGDMPLASYTLIHGYAKLNDAQKTTIINWATRLRDTMKANNPADSLIMPKRKKS